MISDDQVLISLAKKKAIYEEIEISTIELSKELRSTQQTISRKLMRLEDESLLLRQPTTKGIKLRISDKGMKRLEEKYRELRQVFEKRLESFEGHVESGLGEGRYYVGLDRYKEQFKEKLGFIPFPGTLNIRVSYSRFMEFITAQEKIMIQGFESNNRTFGPIVAYRIKVNDSPAAIIIPERTSHNRDTLEVISKTSLRNKFQLKDGDRVRLSI